MSVVVVRQDKPVVKVVPANKAVVVTRPEDSPAVVVVKQDKSVVKVTQAVKPIVKISTSRGLPGLPGADGVDGVDGEQGPPGPPGAAGSAPQAYTHNQSSPLAVWTINHNLGYRPGGIVVIDSGGNDVEGIVSHIDSNTLTITFLSPFGGFAYLS